MAAAEPDVRQALEAILFVADEPVPLQTIARVLERDEEVVAAELQAMADEHAAEGRGTVVREVGGGWRLYTAPEAAPVVERLVADGRRGRLTQAALETLAVVAYRQPVARQDVSDIRGVDADASLRTLVQRGLVEEVGRDPGPGKAILYGTTTEFLEQLGLRSLDDLPPLTDHLPDAPAPDEPAPADLRAARDRLAAGRELPSTGRPRWDPDAEVADGAGTDAEQEMARLGDSLEEAARHAMQRLRAAVERTDEATSEDVERAGPEGEGR